METQVINWTEIEQGSFCRLYCTETENRFVTKSRLPDGDYLAFEKSNSEFSSDRYTTFSVKNGVFGNTALLMPEFVIKIAKIA